MPVPSGVVCAGLVAAGAGVVGVGVGVLAAAPPDASVETAAVPPAPASVVAVVSPVAGVVPEELLELALLCVPVPELVAPLEVGTVNAGLPLVSPVAPPPPPQATTPPPSARTTSPTAAVRLTRRS